MAQEVKNIGTKVNTINSLQHLIKGKDKITGLVASGAGLAPSAMTWNIVSQYKNYAMKSAIPVYRRSFSSESINADLPRFTALGIGSGNLVMSRDVDGLKFSNTSGNWDLETFKLPGKFVAPSGILRINVAKYTGSIIRVGGGLAKDSNNFMTFSWERVNTKTTFNSKAGGTNGITDYANIVPGTSPFSIIMLWGNNRMSLYAETETGIAYIGTKDISNQSIKTEANLNDFSPSIHVYLGNNENLTIDSVDYGYFEGIGHADIRSVTYEDGSPIVVNNKRYITASTRVSGINGASGAISVFSINQNGTIDELVSQITVRKAGTLENGTSAKLVYDRDEKKWIYIARAFPSPGGNLHVGTTKQNLLNKGVHIVDVSTSTDFATESLDADLIKQSGTYTIVYHGGNPRNMRIATSTDLINWTESFNGASGEGTTFAKVNGQWYLVGAKTQTEMGVRLLSDPSTEIGTITLTPSPGIVDAVGGNPWGTIIPVYDGTKTRFLLIVFTRDMYIADATNIYTYGEIWSYEAEEIETGAEFYLKPQVELGY